MTRLFAMVVLPEADVVRGVQVLISLTSNLHAFFYLLFSCIFSDNAKRKTGKLALS